MPIPKSKRPGSIDKRASSPDRSYKADENAGLTSKQALAIAYAVARRVSGGGLIEGEPEASEQRSAERMVDQNCVECQGMAKGGPACMYHGGLKEDQNTPADELGHIENDPGKPDQEDQYFADGGEYHESGQYGPDSYRNPIIDQLMAKRQPTHNEQEVGLDMEEDRQPDDSEDLMQDLYASSDEPDEEDDKMSLSDRLAKRRAAAKKTVKAY